MKDNHILIEQSPYETFKQKRSVTCTSQCECALIILAVYPLKLRIKSEVKIES